MAKVANIKCPFNGLSKVWSWNGPLCNCLFFTLRECCHIHLKSWVCSGTQSQIVYTSKSHFIAWTVWVLRHEPMDRFHTVPLQNVVWLPTNEYPGLQNNIVDAPLLLGTVIPFSGFITWGQPGSVDVIYIFNWCKCFGLVNILMHIGIGSFHWPKRHNDFLLPIMENVGLHEYSINFTFFSSILIEPFSNTGSLHRKVIIES